MKKLRDDKGGVSQELGEASLQAAEGTTIDYYFDGDYVIMKIEGASVMAYYTQVQGLISQRRGSSFYFYHYDGLGSTKALTDANQNVQASYIYDAWGNISQTNGTIINPYLYVGELGYYADGDSGMYLLTQRWYNPVVGRFVARDPWKVEENRYIYAFNSPLVFIDPLGLEAIKPTPPTPSPKYPIDAIKWFYQCGKAAETGIDIGKICDKHIEYDRDVMKWGRAMWSTCILYCASIQRCRLCCEEVEEWRREMGWPGGLLERQVEWCKDQCKRKDRLKKPIPMPGPPPLWPF